MSSSMNQIASQLQKAITESDKRKPQPYDTQAEVVRVEPNSNTIWVKIPGGVDETPVRKTIDAKEGDTVQVRIANGRGWLVGNDTRPPTDDATAIIANENADIAGEAAKEAIDIASEAVEDAARAKIAAESAEADAARAATAAESAEGDANRAETAATNAEANAGRSATAAESAEQNASTAASAATAAKSDAESAAGSASSAASSASQAATDAATAKADAKAANTAAKGALNSASIVEDVVGTLNWISKHGTYTKTTDTAINPDKVYFIYQNGGYLPVAEPVAADLSKYYELTVNESVQNYVSSHIALTNAGLYIINDNSSYKILLASDGMKVYDSDGNLVSTFGESIIFSSSRDQTIGSNNAQITFDADTNKITIKGNVVFDGVQQIIEKADKSDIPTKTSDLTNDSDFATSSDIPTKTSDLTNDSNYVDSSTAQGYANAAEGRAKLVAENYITDTNQSGTGTRVHPSASTDNSIVLDTSGMEVFKGGTDSAHSVAFYGDTARIGKRGETNVNIDYHSLQMTDLDGKPYVWFSDLRDNAQEYTVTMDFTREEVDRSATRQGKEYTFDEDHVDVDLTTLKVLYNNTEIDLSGISYSVGNKVIARPAEGANNIDCYLYLYNSAYSTGYYTFSESDVVEVTYLDFNGNTNTVSATSAALSGNQLIWLSYRDTADGYRNRFPKVLDVKLNTKVLFGCRVYSYYIRLYASQSLIPDGETFTISYKAPDTTNVKAYTLGTRDPSQMVGMNSFTFGTNNAAKREGSAAFGTGTIVNHKNGFAIGAYNDTKSSMFSVGTGTSNEDRKSALNVTSAGELYIDSGLSMDEFDQYEYLYSLQKRQNNIGMHVSLGIMKAIDYGMQLYTDISNYTLTITKSSGSNEYYQLIDTDSEFNIPADRISRIYIRNDPGLVMVRFIPYGSTQWAAICNRSCTMSNIRLRIIWTAGGAREYDPYTLWPEGSD